MATHDKSYIEADSDSQDLYREVSSVIVMQEQHADFSQNYRKLPF